MLNILIYFGKFFFIKLILLCNITKKTNKYSIFRSAVKELGDYSELADFALSVLSLPHANADCERVFSTVNCMKTKLRNRLNTETINGALHTKQHIKGGRDSGKNCVNFQPNDEMFSRMTKNILYENQTITKVPQMIIYLMY